MEERSVGGGGAWVEGGMNTAGTLSKLKYFIISNMPLHLP